MINDFMIIEYNSNNYDDLFENYNKFLDNNPNFNPNGSNDFYNKMYAIQTIITAFSYNNYGIILNNDIWRKNIVYIYNLFMRLYNNFNMVLYEYTLYMCLYKKNHYAYKMNIISKPECELMELIDIINDNPVIYTK